MKMDYEAQEKCLSTKTTKFMEYLIRRGVLPDRNLVDQESAARRQEIAQKAYHNTELLLQNYRELVWALETTPDQIASELEMPFATLDELIDRIDLESALGNSKVENRLISVAKSRVLIDRIHELYLFSERSRRWEKIFTELSIRPFWILISVVQCWTFYIN